MCLFSPWNVIYFLSGTAIRREYYPCGPGVLLDGAPVLQGAAGLQRIGHFSALLAASELLPVCLLSMRLLHNGGLVEEQQERAGGLAGLHGPVVEEGLLSGETVVQAAGRLVAQGQTALAAEGAAANRPAGQRILLQTLVLQAAVLRRIAFSNKSNNEKK